MPAEPIDPKTIDFREVVDYAERAQAAYWKPEEIQQKYPLYVRVEDNQEVDVQYFVERDHDQQLHTITIRGTANKKNAKIDLKYLQSRDDMLGIDLHRGFKKAANLIYPEIKTLLGGAKNYKVRLTGHSLGAALSTILMMYLQVDGFTVEKSINFGQPKVTDGEGVIKYDSLPLIRVVNETDPVPLAPPSTLLSGLYQHMSPELVLLRGEFYSFLTRFLAERESVNNLSENIGDMDVPDHYMDNYITSLRGKLNKANLILFADRKKYLD